MNGKGKRKSNLRGLFCNLFHEEGGRERGREGRNEEGGSREGEKVT